MVSVFAVENHSHHSSLQGGHGGPGTSSLTTTTATPSLATDASTLSGERVEAVAALLGGDKRSRIATGYGIEVIPPREPREGKGGSANGNNAEDEEEASCRGGLEVDGKLAIASVGDLKSAAQKTNGGEAGVQKLPKENLSGGDATLAAAVPVQSRKKCVESGKKGQKTEREGRKGTPWTESEHLAFLDGLNELGKGNWRAIAKSFVPTRTPTQVASHAQKHQLRVAGATKRKSRFTAMERAFNTFHNGGSTAESGPDAAATARCEDKSCTKRQSNGEALCCGSDLGSNNGQSSPNAFMGMPLFAQAQAPQATGGAAGVDYTALNSLLLASMMPQASPLTGQFSPSLLSTNANAAAMQAVALLASGMNPLPIDGVAHCSTATSSSFTKSASAPNLALLGDLMACQQQRQRQQAVYSPSSILFRPTPSRPPASQKSSTLPSYLCPAPLTHVNSAPSLNSLQNQVGQKQRHPATDATANSGAPCGSRPGKSQTK